MQTQNISSRFSPWPYAVVGFLSAFFLYLIGFVIFSSFHSMDLVTENYYEQEVEFQEQIDRIQRSREIRSSVELSHDPERKTLSLTLPQDVSGQKPEGTVRFYRPSDALLDFEVALNLGPTGTQIVDAERLKPGFWRIKVTWEADGEEYYFEDIVVL